MLTVQEAIRMHQRDDNNILALDVLKARDMPIVSLVDFPSATRVGYGPYPQNVHRSYDSQLSNKLKQNERETEFRTNQQFSAAYEKRIGLISAQHVRTLVKFLHLPVEAEMYLSNSKVSVELKSAGLKFFSPQRPNPNVYNSGTLIVNNFVATVCCHQQEDGSVFICSDCLDLPGIDETCFRNCGDENSCSDILVAILSNKNFKNSYFDATNSSLIDWDVHTALQRSMINSKQWAEMLDCGISAGGIIYARFVFMLIKYTRMAMYVCKKRPGMHPSCFRERITRHGRADELDKVYTLQDGYYNWWDVVNVIGTGENENKESILDVWYRADPEPESDVDEVATRTPMSAYQHLIDAEPRTEEEEEKKDESPMEDDSEEEKKYPVTVMNANGTKKPHIYNPKLKRKAEQIESDEDEEYEHKDEPNEDSDESMLSEVSNASGDIVLSRSDWETNAYLKAKSEIQLKSILKKTKEDIADEIERDCDKESILSLKKRKAIIESLLEDIFGDVLLSKSDIEANEYLDGMTDAALESHLATAIQDIDEELPLDAAYDSEQEGFEFNPNWRKKVLEKEIEKRHGATFWKRNTNLTNAERERNSLVNEAMIHNEGLKKRRPKTSVQTSKPVVRITASAKQAAFLSAKSDHHLDRLLKQAINQTADEIDKEDGKKRKVLIEEEIARRGVAKSDKNKKHVLAQEKKLKKKEHKRARKLQKRDQQ